MHEMAGQFSNLALYQQCCFSYWLNSFQMVPAEHLLVLPACSKDLDSFQHILYNKIRIGEKFRIGELL